MTGVRAASIGCVMLCMTPLLLGRVHPVGDANVLGPPAGEPAEGKQVFEKRCTGCHAMEENREGPRLQGVFGRTSGTVAGFTYSSALIQARIVWNESTLEQWLTDPDTLVPGNNMDFHVAKPQERRELIMYLKQASGK